MEWVALSGLNLINGTTHDNKKEAMWREQGQFALRRLTIPAATSFLGRQTKHASCFRTSTAAVSAARMTEQEVTAARTDLKRACILGKYIAWRLQHGP